MNKRNETIDHLRALAILVMILTHSTAYYFKFKSVFYLWNILHFAVPIFVFCAAYVFFKKYGKDKDFNVPIYLKKRLKRILIPYYAFLTVYFPIIFLTRPKNLNPSFINRSLLVFGGIDINWLVLLFVFFAFLLPIIHYLIARNRLLFFLYSIVSFSSIIYLLFSVPSHIDYKLYMWLPWSIIIVYAYFFQKYENNKKFILLNIVLGICLFIILYSQKISAGKSLILYNNKYPPNIYFLSYGFTLLNIFYLALKKWPIKNNAICKLSFFISVNSYSLFFIHYLVIYLLGFYMIQNKMSWPIFFIVVLIFSLAIQKLLGLFFELWQKKHFLSLKPKP